MHLMETQYENRGALLTHSLVVSAYHGREAVVELLSSQKQKWMIEAVQILVDREQRTKQELEANLSLSRSCPSVTYFYRLDHMSWGF